MVGWSKVNYKIDDHTLCSFIHSFILVFIHSYNKNGPKNTKGMSRKNVYETFAKCRMNMHGHCFDFGWSFVLVENVSILKLIVLASSMEIVSILISSFFIMIQTWICTNVHLQMNIFCQFLPIFLSNDRWMTMPLH